MIEQLLNLLTNPLVLGVILSWAAYYWWINVWNKKDNIVYVYMYNYINHEAVLLTDKPIKGRTKIVDGATILKLPKRWSDRPMPAPNTEHFIPNNKGMRMVSLVRLDEDKFTYMKSNYNLKESYQNLKLLDNNNAFWAANEIEKAYLRNTSKDKFAWIKANLVAIIMLVIAFMVVVYAIKTSQDMVNNAAQENIKSSKDILNQIDGLKKYLTNGESNINKESINSNVDVPIGRQNVKDTTG